MFMGWWWVRVALAGAMGEVHCAVSGHASTDFLIQSGRRYEGWFIPHALGVHAPPRAPSLAALCTSVRYEKTYRASQRTNRLWVSGVCGTALTGFLRPLFSSLAHPVKLVCSFSRLNTYPTGFYIDLYHRHDRTSDSDTAPLRAHDLS